MYGDIIPARCVCGAPLPHSAAPFAAELTSGHDGAAPNVPPAQPAPNAVSYGWPIWVAEPGAEQASSPDQRATNATPSAAGDPADFTVRDRNSFVWPAWVATPSVMQDPSTQPYAAEIPPAVPPAPPHAIWQRQEARYRQRIFALLTLAATMSILFLSLLFGPSLLAKHGPDIRAGGVQTPTVTPPSTSTPSSTEPPIGAPPPFITGSTPVPNPAVTPTATPTISPTVQPPTATPTVAPTVTPTETPAPSPTPTDTPQPTPSATPSPSPTPTDTPSPEPTMTPEPTDTPIPTDTPTPTSTIIPPTPPVTPVITPQPVGIIAVWPHIM